MHRLELTGFGPFRETQVVDFDAFDADGLFLISGRTGAGKSSILDGVSFALYGSVPRYDGGERRLRSDHCFLGDPTEVRLEFTVGDVRWRVTRSPEYERPAKRGDKLTTEAPRAVLEQWIGGDWVGRAAKPREVAHELDEILGLTAQQFQQVILLAQNKFSRFLLAGNDERQALLRTLFGTRRFDQYIDDLEQRRRDAQKQLDTAGEHARTILDLAEQLIDSHELAGDTERPAELAARRQAAELADQRAAYRIEARATERGQADAAAAAATAAHAALVERAQRLADRAAARVRLDTLEAESPARDLDRSHLERARAAEALRAPLDAFVRADAARTDATAARAQAQQAWVDAGGDADADLESLIDQLTGDVARWQAAVAQERELAEKEALLITSRRAESESAETLAALDAQQALIPAERARLEAARTAAAADAARRDVVGQQRDLLVERLGAAREAAELEPEVEAAEAAYLRASTAAGEAAGTVTRLLQRRMAGYAGELSQRLVDGEPCEVCGSTEHPHPAETGDDTVTDDDLTVAERRRDDATTAESSAAQAARAVRERRAAARARMGDVTGDRDAVTVLSDELAKAEDELAVAERAVSAVARFAEQLHELDVLAAAAKVERAERAATLAAEAEKRVVLETTVQSLEVTVAAARGDHETVSQRVAAATARRDLARGLGDAQRTVADRERVYAEALADRDARLAASDFRDADDAAASLLDDAARSEIDACLNEHAAALSAARARLLELELAAADDAEIGDDEVAGAERAAAAADHARTVAIGALRDAESTAGRLRELLLQADEAYAAVAARAEDAAVVSRLADTVAGRAPNTKKMDLETFVLAAELEEIVAAANLRLTEMSSGRYTLHHSDALQARGKASGLGIDVLDAHTGRMRSPQSLSGGETFLASLALALGLAEVVTSRAGGLRLDTLFVDEGFGSLDPDTLELAMRTLDDLRVGGRTVGVISHVEAMKEQLPAQLTVTATPDGPSTISQDLPAPVV
nr:MULTISPECIES: SMC family ATPase [Microbacterium]